VKETNDTFGAQAVGILQSGQKLDDALAKYKTVIIHGLEGAHHLGRHLQSADYVDAIRALYAQGFLVFTLSHFFLNEVCDSAGGIPTSDLAVTAYKIEIAPKPGLTPSGELVVREALKNGMLIDLTHSTLETRRKVYAINKEMAAGGAIPTLRPLAFTHTGVRPLYRLGNDATFESLEYLPDEDDIAAIKDCRGVMGVMFQFTRYQSKPAGFGADLCVRVLRLPCVHNRPRTKC
jgi:microsomal dipeptidase-like Zn-dependent dipeptidase